MSSRNLYILEEEGIAHSCCLIKIGHWILLPPFSQPQPSSGYRRKCTCYWRLVFASVVFQIAPEIDVPFSSFLLLKMPADSLGHIISLSADNSNEKRRYICITESTNKSANLFGFINGVYPEGVHGEPVEFWKVRLLFFFQLRDYSVNCLLIKQLVVISLWTVHLSFV